MHDRSLKSEMRVRHRQLRPQPEHVLLADVQAAHEADGPVHHEDLAMIAQIDERHAPGPDRVHEACAGHTLTPQPALDPAAEIAAPDPVHQNPDLNPAPLRRHQSLGKTLPHLIIAENIGAQDDRFLA